MMYDVYWYYQMKKNEWLWKFWKRNDLYENFEKRGAVGNEIHGKKGQKDKQWSTKHTHKTKDRVTQTPLKTGEES
jgi:hypothetical protein